MENTQNMVAMLNQIYSPAFLVQNGTIAHINEAASQRLIAVGTPVQELLITGAMEYPEFRDGCLYLTLRIDGKSCGTSVTKMVDYDLFVLEQDADQQELASMALSAQELRNPLSNVMAIADNLFPLSSAENDPHTQSQIARINRGLYQMLRIVSNMSDAYRYSQDASPQLELRDVTSVLQEIFDRNQALVCHTEISLSFQNSSECILSLVDTEKLERAVNNLISNSLKFTRTGGRIDAALTRRGRMLYLTVTDSGSDLRSQNLNVFHRYLRLPGIEDGRFGIGLGMVLIRAAAVAHGGTVLMESLPQGGTRTTMTMLIRQPSDTTVRSAILPIDYLGGRNHSLIELSEHLPASLYQKENIN